MKDSYKLVWSDEALTNLKDVLDYLEQKWTFKEIQRFSRLFDNVLDLIKLNPHLFPISEKNPKFHKAVITKQTSLYYKVDKSEVIVSSIYVSRRNPKF